MSSVFWDNDDDLNKIAWSYATGATGGMTSIEVQTKANRIPMMAVGDYVIVVETFMAYEPIFNIGLKAQWYRAIHHHPPALHVLHRLGRE